MLDVAAHEEKLKDPGSYRPAKCRCGGTRLHLHERRERRLRGILTAFGCAPVVVVLVFLCSLCRATWRVLPAFIARCLQSPWAVVDAAVGGTEPLAGPKVPARTLQRWKARLAQAARGPMQVLATSGKWALRAVAQAVGLEGTRGGLAHAFAEGFGGGARPGALPALAEILHRLCAGIRLM